MSILSLFPEFPGRLRAARKRLGLTQEELAEKTGLYQEQLSAYERGKKVPGAVVLKKLAEDLEVSTDDLLGQMP